LKDINSENNYKELALAEVYPDSKSYQQISFVNDLIFWVDKYSSADQFQSAIFVRPFKSQNSFIQNLTGDSFNVKNNFHGYGGKAYRCFYTNEKYYLIWIDQRTKSLWIQIYENNKSNDDDQNFLISQITPKRLTKSLKGNFDASFVLFQETMLFGLLEKDERDYLFSLNINQYQQEIKILKRVDGFASSLSSNEDQTFISWIEWKTSDMCWDNNYLFFAEINIDGHLQKEVKFKSEIFNSQKLVSFFQPFWISRNILICSEDSSGWWNLLVLEINNLEDITIKKRIKKEYFEYGEPEWMTGISLYSGSIDNLFCIPRNKEICKLEYYKNLTLHKTIDLPFTTLRDIQVSSNKLVCVASNDLSHEQLLELDIGKFSKCLSPSINIISKEIKFYSKAESFWFKGYGDQETHSWIYKPYISRFEKPPLILRVHGGPTTFFTGELNLEVQYWLSKGFFVAEVNYGGSSGFGRKYRERLKGKWGIVDSYDSAALVNALIKKRLVDPNRIIIAGNSAGGFTALNSIYQNNLFRAAICKYPVIDLNKMRLNTHRFERNYLNSLIGEFDANQEKYFERSPINNVHKIDKPILLFHGEKDQVVDYKESLEFQEKILKKNIYSKIFLFEDEGHGFRNIRNKIIVLEKTEEFIRFILNI